MTKRGPARAAIYCRISQDRTGEGLGVARQEEDCRAWAERHGWQVAEVYVDDDISAYKGKVRPSYRRLLADIEKGDRDGLIAWHPDRLHRSPRELEDFIDLLELTGIPVGTVTAGDIDLTTPTGRMTARIVGAVARHESDHKSERIRRKHVELAQNGQVAGGGIRPFGYNADRKTLRQDEAELVREAAERILNGEGLRTLVSDWNDRGVSTVTGVPWSTPTVRRLLMSGRIMGWREHHGQLVCEAEWESIIDEDTGRRLRHLLKDPSRSTGDTTARSYLLAGMIRCGFCGETLVARPVRRKGHRYRRYACSKDKGGCNRVGIGAQPLEDMIAEAVLVALDSPKLAKLATTNGSQSASSGQVEEIERRLIELADLFAEGDISKAEWARAREKLTSRLDEARKSEAAMVRKTAIADQLARPDVLRKEWPEMSLDRQRMILKAVLEGITIAQTTKAGNKFDPGRVQIRWRG